MPGKKDRRVVSVSRRARESNASNVTPADIARLWWLLLSKPDEALREFQPCGIACLAELEHWQAFREATPDLAEILVKIAASYGIPERLP